MRTCIGNWCFNKSLVPFKWKMYIIREKKPQNIGKLIITRIGVGVANLHFYQKLED